MSDDAPPPVAIRPFAIPAHNGTKPKTSKVKSQRALQDRTLTSDDPEDGSDPAPSSVAVPPQKNTFASQRAQLDPSQTDEDRYRQDVGDRPQAPTSDDYLLQPVDGYGQRLLAMMGGGSSSSTRQKSVLESPAAAVSNKPLRKVVPWGGFRGIGAEKLDASTQAELGAWGIGASARPSGRRHGQSKSTADPRSAIHARKKRTAERDSRNG